MPHCLYHRTAAQRTHDDNQVVQLRAYRYPTAVFIDTAEEAEAFPTEVVGAANVRVVGLLGRRMLGLCPGCWAQPAVPCRCGTLLETQRCGHCECGEDCTGGECRCVCPQPQQGEVDSDFACGCAVPQ